MGIVWRVIAAGAVSFVMAVSAVGQKALPPPVRVADNEAWNHIRGERRSIHVGLRSLSQRRESFESVKLEVVVSENGIVDSAKAVSGPQELYGQAEELERHRAFVPFRKDGLLVRVAFQDSVSVEPPERWADTHVPFPEKVDLSTLAIRLRRTACYGTCPAYTVTVHGNGMVEYVGESFVKVAGAQSAHLSKVAVEELLSAFRHADFLSARDGYSLTVTDLPTFILTLRIGDQTKMVSDYAGGEVGMPDTVQDLERLVDETAGTAKWVRGYKP